MATRLLGSKASPKKPQTTSKKKRSTAKKTVRVPKAGKQVTGGY